MAGEFTAVGLGSQPPDMMTKLSGLLTIKHQQQALQGQAAQVQQEQQSARQRSNIAKYDWSKHIGEDGTIDLNSLNDPELQNAAGDQYLDVLAHAVQAKTSQLEARQKLVSLKSDQRNALSDMLGPLISDKDVAEGTDKGKQKINDAFSQYGELYGKDVLPVIQAYAPGVQKAPPNALLSGLRAIQMQAQSASQQVATQQRSDVNTGAALRNVNPLAAADNTGDIALNLGPGAQQSVITGPDGNQYVQYRDPAGNIVGTAPLAGTPRFKPGEKNAKEVQAATNQENTTQNRVAAGSARQQLNQIDHALDLSKQVTTGAAAGRITALESGLASIPGFHWTASMTNAEKMQELNKFSERIASDSNRVLGINASTDAQRESIKQQNANIDYGPKAIQNVLKFAKSQTMAMEAKGNAQETWLQQPGHDATNQHDFETTFRRAYDPVVFQLKAAESKDEQREILSKLSPDRLLELKKSKAALTEMGALNGR